MQTKSFIEGVGRLGVVVLVLSVTTMAAGQEVRVNEWTVLDERARALATDGVSSIRALWTSWQQFCPDRQLVSRQLDLKGRFLTPDTLMENCSGYTSDGGLAMLSTGDFLVVRNAGWLYGTIFDAGGTSFGPEFVISDSSAGNIAEPSALMHPDGKYVVYWTVSMPTYADVRARVVGPDGSLPGSIEVLPEAPGTQYGVRMDVFGSGDLLAAWIDVGGNIVSRQYDADLIPLGPESILNPHPMTTPQGLGLAANGEEYIAAWGYGPGNSEVYARRFNQFTGPRGIEFQVNTNTNGHQIYPRCEMDGQGRSLVLWEHVEQQPDYDVYGQRLDFSGNRFGNQFRVNATEMGEQRIVDLVMLEGGDFAVELATDSAGVSHDVLFRRFFFPVSLVVGAGPGAGNHPLVETRRPDGDPGTMSSVAYGSGGFGVEVGVGELDGDDRDEVIAGPGPSPVFGPHVRGFQADGTPVKTVGFYAYGTLRYGVKPVGADPDADAFSEILTAPGPGEAFGPHLRAWNYDGVQITPIAGVNLYAYATLKFGANLSGGDVDGDGFDELLSGPGPGAIFGAHLRAFDIDGAYASPISAIDDMVATEAYGLRVGAADLEADGVAGYGDGFDEILVGLGPGPSNGAALSVYDYDASLLRLKDRPPAAFGSTYGLIVAGGDVDAGDTEEVVTSSGPDPAAPARILTWEWDPDGWTSADPGQLDILGSHDFIAFSAQGYGYGATVAVGSFE